MKLKTSIIITLVCWLITFVTWVEGYPIFGTICFFAPLLIDLFITNSKDE